MDWTLLLVAGIFEIAWAIGLKYTEGFTRFWPSLATILANIASVAFLALATRTLPLGTAYAIWTGIGVCGTAIFGVILFGEPINLVRGLFVSLVIVGIVGLKLTFPKT
jgi:quaternary ammonium compound-resistance protein SugE